MRLFAAETRRGMAKVTIYHNPDCGTSRNVLAIIREQGIEPEVIEYLQTPPSRERVKQLVRDMGVGVRDILRQKGTPYDELGLGDPSLTDDQLLDAIEKHPILMNRPIVVAPRGTRLCRPSETVREIL
jgi:arsenate reductase